MAVTGMADMAAFGNGAPVPLSAVAERQRLSLAFLEQIFGKLRRAGLVESRRGAQGGYVLAKEPGAITLAAIVTAVEEEVRSTACQPGGALGCTGTSARCLTHRLWADLDDHIESWLHQKTLADVQAIAGEVAHA
jgi:Rrf2 family protein